MKTIFHIISRLDVGGAEQVAINIASSRSGDCSHHIVELQRGHSAFTRQMIAELRQKGIPYHRSWMPVYFHLHCYVDRLISILFPLRFLFLWLRYRPDVVHSHTEMPDMAVWLSLRMFPFIKVKVVRTIHNTTLWSGMRLTGALVERFMKRRGANIAISPNVQEAYHKRYGTMPPIIFNGVAPVRQRPYAGIVPGKVNILFAGRLEEQKGIATLYSIIKALREDLRYHFHILGSGRQQAMVEALRGQGNVNISSPIHGIATFMASFDYIIMPSLHEGLSILAIEASMNGVPLLINRCAGLTDTLPPDWPLAVDGNDLHQWLYLFEEVMPGCDRTSLIQQAHEYAMQHFSMEKMQREYEERY